MRRHAERFFERAREMRLGGAAHASQPLNRPLFLRGRIHAVLGAEETAQQRGVLGLASLFSHEDRSRFLIVRRQAPTRGSRCLWRMARPKRFELLTPRFVADR